VTATAADAQYLAASTAAPSATKATARLQLLLLQRLRRHLGFSSSGFDAAVHHERQWLRSSATCILAAPRRPQLRQQWHVTGTAKVTTAETLESIAVDSIPQLQRLAPQRQLQRRRSATAVSSEALHCFSDTVNIGICDRINSIAVSDLANALAFCTSFSDCMLASVQQTGLAALPYTPTIFAPIAPATKPLLRM